MSDDFSVLHTIAGLAAWAGGPSRTVSSLTSHLSVIGVPVALLTLARNGEALVLPSLGNVRMISVPSGGAVEALRLRQVRSEMNRYFEGKAAVLVHDHGLWLPINHVVASVCARTDSVVRVVSPEGMLEPWSLSFGRGKKKLAWHLYQHRDLQRATAFQATGEAEAANIRNLGFKQPIALIPQGVTFPAASVRKARPETGKKQALFLSRLHPKKGIPDLIEAWRILRPAGWHLKIIGGEEVGHRRHVQDLIASAGLRDEIEVCEEVDDTQKWDIYAGSDLFVLPSYSENFGVVIAEALASGVPVITTKATPWKELDEHDCGWWIDTGVPSLTATLKVATSMDVSALRAMGQRGANLMAEKYSWDRVAISMAAFYRWLLGRGPKPDCVV